MSDNGTDFVGVSLELKDMLHQLDEKKIKISIANKGINWHCNSPYEPHFGGVHKTLIKLAIYGILGCRAITDKELTTAFASAEHLVSPQPLTFEFLDIKDNASLT